MAVLGAGFISVETTEALLNAGLSDVTVIEMARHVLPPLDPDVACEMESAMTRAGVKVILGDAVRDFEFAADPASCHATAVVLTSGKRVAADLFIIGLGVRPNAELARDAGLAVGPRGGITVDQGQLTSDASIWAAGDVCETLNRITQERSINALAGPASKQGRVAGCNAAYGEQKLAYHGSLGTAIVAFRDCTCGITGLSETRARALGFDVQVLCMTHNDHAGYYPGAHELDLKLVTDRKTGKILGAQVVGSSGVDKRIDVIATAIHAGLGADELGDLDLAYAPQFGSARDPVIMLGLAASDIMTGNEHMVTFTEALTSGGTLIDCRTQREYDLGHVEGAICVPVDDIRATIKSGAAAQWKQPIFVYCRSGFRAYLATRILQGHNIGASNITGGWITYRCRRK